ncbi:hypothetical protein [uncultured Tolumonas sp.]|uniref:hypothetical protein n=1 Tax=uncultured Tolumonas sp. TaxID=263765 RepID=UPI002A0A366C|nr:hypothetical protein [uncultured Tolumonas sp.]
MFNKLTNEQQLIVIESAVSYIATTSTIYDPEDLKDKLAVVCDVIAEKFIGSPSPIKQEKLPG